MSEKMSSGYKGHALKAIENVGAEIGDMLRVTKGNEILEGILIPRSEYGDENHLVIKLKNGYNIGVRLTADVKVEKTGKGTKPAFAAPPPPSQNQSLPGVAIISTGGTIASRVDYRTGGVRSALTASDLYSVVPELGDIARIEAHILYSLFSENLTGRHWAGIAKTVATHIATGVDGVVIAHGTDTMGYTAAALSFALQNLPVPVIIVGAQRSADRPSSDAATNLIGAVTAAAKAPFAEIAVAMHETPSDKVTAIHRGTKVRKCHTSRRDAFKSINSTPIAEIEDRKLTMLTEEYKKRNKNNKLVLKPEFSEKVALIKFYPGMNHEVIDWHNKNGYRGIILEGSGLGHISSRCHETIGNAVKDGIVVAMTSQCIWGRVNMNVYDSGRDLQALGVVPLEDMLAETALAKLMWTLGQTADPEEAKKLLITDVAGELSTRTLPEKNCEESEE
ncbi:Glu-tRNA(Gln) amidotransferase subunit GatD [Candidatus Bathyarchaeota archaeon]|nr:Glu-tRNA(Gln) amidotransferase subunit GatD [Candidatus Bathyarchaeota archaeon]